MTSSSPRRKVLIIEDEPSIRNVLYVLIAGLGCDTDVAYSSQQALSMINRESFDAVLLDLRCSNLPAEQVFSKIKEIRPSLLGRILVITGEVSNPQAMEIVERYCLPQISRNRVFQDLWTCLRPLVTGSRSSETVA